MTEAGGDQELNPESATCDETRALLTRWHSGDRAALSRLLDRHLPWIRGYVHRRLGGLARRDVETGDLVQTVVERVLREGPRFVLDREVPFRRLLARMVENMLKNEAKYQGRARRTPRRERSATDDTVLYLSGERPHKDVTRPDAAAAHAEEREWVVLGMELLPDDAREVVRRREWEGSAFDAIGQELGTTADAARMRYQRALQRLAHYVVLLRAGNVDQALDDADTESE